MLNELKEIEFMQQDGETQVGDVFGGLRRVHITLVMQCNGRDVIVDVERCWLYGIALAGLGVGRG